jgi:L-amino acid N-acyltransferase YncA
MTSSVALRRMELSGWPAVRRIYQEGIDTGHATFESSAPDWNAFDQSKLPDHRHVATSNEGAVLGWAAVSPVSARPVYAGVVEHAIYVAEEARGLGVGKTLLPASSTPRRAQ